MHIEYMTNNSQPFCELWVTLTAEHCKISHIQKDSSYKPSSMHSFMTTSVTEF